MVKPDLEHCSEAKATKWYWSDYHKVCKSCKHNCKQSHVVLDVWCNRYES